MIIDCFEIFVERP